MSENLRFSVEESVWFQKGQEVSELISISLDPDIVIQEHDQYVSIRGALQLTGEYRIDENHSEEEERDFASVRLVNEVITREDGISELNHRFPVDITIPQDRVQSLDDVYVSIETFDYEIPKRGCLHIIADLAISGIQGVTQSPKEEA
ncbi:stage VI sporulation protein D, partial [Aeromonas veronii]|nr:stage VI sporulation protein D [Aeromonas veronii]